MIVVAIIGVLAALAIYGVRKYIANAKTAEARMSLGRIAKDASAAYNREAMSATVLTLGGVAGLSNALCLQQRTRSGGREESKVRNINQPPLNGIIRGQHTQRLDLSQV